MTVSTATSKPFFLVEFFMVSFQVAHLKLPPAKISSRDCLILTASFPLSAVLWVSHFMDAFGAVGGN